MDRGNDRQNGSRHRHGLIQSKPENKLHHQRHLAPGPVASSENQTLQRFQPVKPGVIERAMREGERGPAPTRAIRFDLKQDSPWDVLIILLGHVNATHRCRLQVLVTVHYAY